MTDLKPTHFKPAELKAIKQFLPDIGNLEHQRTAPSSVTTAWGVKWDADLCARDLAQNFRDANKEDIDSIKVLERGTNIVITAPAEFNLQRLFFLGSEKGESDIGKYGEGFKAAALNLLRDFKVTPIVVSGKNAVRLSVATQSIEDTDLHPIVYDFFVHDGSAPGAHLFILGCPQDLAHAVKHSMEHFFWSGHPILGDLIQSSPQMDVYRAKTGDCGWGFYRGLRRCKIPHIPLVFNLKKDLKALDKKIALDRDRTAFNDQVAATYFSAIAKQMQLKVAVECVRLSKDHWTSGSGLLSTIPGALQLYYQRDRVCDWFGSVINYDHYFAASEMEMAHAMHRPEYRRVLDEFKAANRIQLPGYFASFGVTTIDDEIKRRAAEMRDKIRKVGSAPPTPAEEASLKLLISTLSKWYRDIEARIHRFRYLVCQSEEILGQLRSGSRFGETEVLLNASLFVGPFPQAMATLLHEYSHRFGDDGSRGFTDALTEIIEATIEHHAEIGALKEQWQERIRVVTTERMGAGVPSLTRLQALPLQDIHRLIQSAPEEVRQALLGDEDAVAATVSKAKVAEKQAAQAQWREFSQAVARMATGSRFVSRETDTVDEVALVMRFEWAEQFDDEVVIKSLFEGEDCFIAVRPEISDNTFVVVEGVMYPFMVENAATIERLERQLLQANVVNAEIALRDVGIVGTIVKPSRAGETHDDVVEVSIAVTEAFADVVNSVARPKKKAKSDHHPVQPGGIINFGIYRDAVDGDWSIRINGRPFFNIVAGLISAS